MTGRDKKARAASVQFACPGCEGEFHLPCGIAPETGEGHGCCPGCGFKFGSGIEALGVDSPVEKCAICASEDFYIQKDFNRQLGLMVALSSLMGAFLVMLLVDHLTGIYCLFALAATDFLVYWRWKNVTVCYLCHAIYRGFRQNPDHEGFYLGNEEKYKHLRSDWIEGLAKEK